MPPRTCEGIRSAPHGPGVRGVTDELGRNEPIPSTIPARIESLDQFRGYTVVGMLLVNFLGGYQVVPAILKHHNTYCSYADTIMPQFFFAVGFAYRLTFLRRVSTIGMRPATVAVIRRNLGLILLGFVLYHLDGGFKTWEEARRNGLIGFAATAFQRSVFQTLVHIALASLWVLPVIAAGPATRLAYLAATSGLHLWISHRFYFEWAWNRPVIDGGPAGFLSWSIPLLVGSLAYDVVSRGGRSVSRRLFVWSIALMAPGYGLSRIAGPGVPWPFLAPDGPVSMWSMSQRTGSVFYMAFSAGFSLAIYALFVAMCDERRFRSTTFRAFGRNALAAYILHELVATAVKPYFPGDSPAWFVAAGFMAYFTINSIFIRGLERDRIFLRL
jgi:predicted acyltransferase